MRMDSSKPNLLIIGDYLRKDILYFFDDLSFTFNLFFIHYNYDYEIRNKVYSPYIKILFYYQFSSAFSLLKKIKPKKVLFFNFDSFNDLALLMASKECGIKTYHIEHGFRDYNIIRYLYRHQKKISIK